MIMDYLNYLRQYVGHQPLLMVGATTLIVDARNRLLLLKRSDSGRWGPPGGAVEPGEEIETAARREVREETGLDIGGMNLFGVFSGPGQYYKYPNGDEVFNVTIVYLCETTASEIALSDEHTEWHWFSIHEIPEDISPPIIPVIAKYVETYG